MNCLVAIIYRAIPTARHVAAGQMRCATAWLSRAWAVQPAHTNAPSGEAPQAQATHVASAGSQKADGCGWRGLKALQHAQQQPAHALTPLPVYWLKADRARAAGKARSATVGGFGVGGATASRRRWLRGTRLGPLPVLRRASVQAAIYGRSRAPRSRPKSSQSHASDNGAKPAEKYTGSMPQQTKAAWAAACRQVAGRPAAARAACHPCDAADAPNVTR